MSRGDGSRSLARMPGAMRREQEGIPPRAQDHHLLFRVLPAPRGRGQATHRARTFGSFVLLLAPLVGCSARLPSAPLIRETARPYPLSLPASPPEAPPPPPHARAEALLEQLSVERAVLLALENNRDLRIRVLAPVIAGAFEAIERGTFDPEVFGDVEYFRERASQTARATGERFDVTGESTSERVGLRQRLPTGTTVEAAIGHRLDVSDRTPAQNEARLGLSLTQSLLRGLGPEVSLASLRQAELGREASVYELRAFVEALIADTEIAYWRYARARCEIQIFERAVEIARAEAEDVRLRIEVGTLPEIDEAAAQAELALREQSLIDARSRLEEARLRLVRLVSPEPDGRLDAKVEAVSPLAFEAPPLAETAERQALAVRYRPEVGEARLRLEQERLELVVTKNGILPRLDAFVILAKTGFDDTFGGSFSNLDGPNYDVRAGLSLDYFLGHRASAALDLAARATAQQAALAVSNLEELVQLEVRLALNEAERAEAQIAASAVTRRFREAAAAAEKERLDVGSGTALLVAKAQRDLLESEIAEVRAVVDLRIALVKLYLAEGTLLARRGITVVGPTL